MALGSGIRQASTRGKTISMEIVSILNKTVDKYSDGDISESVCESIAKEIDSVYNGNNGGEVRQVLFSIDVARKKMVAKVVFTSVDVPLEVYSSDKNFNF